MPPGASPKSAASAGVARSAPPTRVTPAAGAPAVAKAPAPSSKTAAPLPVEPGRVLVRSAPSGARVAVDGRDHGTTPVSVPDLARGSHRVQVMRDGYATEERRVVVTRARPTLSLNVKLTREQARASRIPSPPAKATPAVAGTLIVESLPSGAQVFLDGKLLGVTPLSLASVPGGDHAIYLDRGGYRRWSSTVHIAASENRVTASLEK